MKINILKFGFIALFSILLIGCDSEEQLDQQPIDTINNQETILITKIDDASEVISDLTLQGFEDEENITKNGFSKRFLPDCAIVAIDIMEGSKRIIIDFGTEGCELRNSHVVKGKIEISYEINIEVRSLVINYTLVDFYVDDIQFAGSRTMTRVRSNENGNPQHSMNIDFEITFADGDQVSRKGNKTREWIEGVGNRNWRDNVFLITGSWETNFANGVTHSTIIKTPLRREGSCRYIVSGVKEFAKTDSSGSLDYGDGSCDNIAVLITTDGEEREIML